MGVCRGSGVNRSGRIREGRGEISEALANICSGNTMLCHNVQMPKPGFLGGIAKLCCIMAHLALKRQAFSVNLDLSGSKVVKIYPSLGKIRRNLCAPVAVCHFTRSIGQL